MSGLSYREVRWLTIQVIAEEWAKERHDRVSLIVQELQLAVINFDQFRAGLDRIEKLPLEEHLPPTSKRLDKEFIEEFCAKQNWPKPKFWFGREDAGPGQVGRPTNMPAIVQELTAIAKRNELKSNLKSQCEHLSDWFRAGNNGVLPPTPGAIANHIRELYWQLKETH